MGVLPPGSDRRSPASTRGPTIRPVLARSASAGYRKAWSNVPRGSGWCWDARIGYLRYRFAKRQRPDRHGLPYFARDPRSGNPSDARAVPRLPRAGLGNICSFEKVLAPHGRWHPEAVLQDCRPSPSGPSFAPAAARCRRRCAPSSPRSGRCVSRWSRLLLGVRQPHRLGQIVNEGPNPRRQLATAADEDGMDLLRVPGIVVLEHRHEPAGVDIRADVKQREPS